MREFDKTLRNEFFIQELLDDTKYILFGLFEKFGATEIQKAKIKSFKTSYNNNLEEKKREKYNPEYIFNDKQKNFAPKILEEKKKLIEYKEQRWYQKLFAKILKIFRKN